MKIDWQALLAILAALSSGIYAIYRLWWKGEPPIEEELDNMDEDFEHAAEVTTEVDHVVNDTTPGPTDADVEEAKDAVDAAEAHLAEVEGDDKPMTESEIDDALEKEGIDVEEL